MGTPALAPLQRGHSEALPSCSLSESPQQDFAAEAGSGSWFDGPVFSSCLPSPASCSYCPTGVFLGSPLISRSASGGTQVKTRGNALKEKGSRKRMFNSFSYSTPLEVKVEEDDSSP